MSSSQPVWTRFSQDPRGPQAVGLRASDRDRDVVVDVLGEAYADGRLDRDEYDSRAEAVTGAKLLADLPPLMEDLVPVQDTPMHTSPADLDRRATRAWKRDLRNAVGAMAGPSVLTTGIWGATAFANGDLYFFWPVFVILGTGANLARVLFGKQDIIEHNREELEQRQRDADA